MVRRRSCLVRKGVLVIALTSKLLSSWTINHYMKAILRCYTAAGHALEISQLFMASLDRFLYHSSHSKASSLASPLYSLQYERIFLRLVASYPPFFPACCSLVTQKLLSPVPSVSTHSRFTLTIPTFPLVPRCIIDTMARITYLIFSFTHRSINAAQSYTSLEVMPAGKTLPPDASSAVITANSLYYAGCRAYVPQLPTAACHVTLLAMSSSLLSNIVSARFWNPSIPTQFQASATSVAKE